MTSGSTVEERLQEALRAAADHGPRATALAARARARAGVRRRRRAVASVVAVAAVAVPVAARLPAGPPAPAPAEDPAPRGTSVPAGFRLEQYRGVSVHVPTTWTTGALADWCRHDDSPGDPVVERPEDRSSSVRCRSPRLGYGLQFLDRRGEGGAAREPSSLRRTGERGSAFPAGSWVGTTCGRCDITVRVVGPDEYVVRYVLSSVVNAGG